MHAKSLAMECSMRDQMLTVLLTIIVPTLMINSISLARLASTGVRSLAGNAVRAARTAVVRAH